MEIAEKKRLAARAALQYAKAGAILGIGTGSTVNLFIAALHASQIRIGGVVSSSTASTDLLLAAGIEVLDLNSVEALDVYIDGADEATLDGALIKGGGGALTREKIVASVSKRFVCIVDDAKIVDRLGKFPLPIEVVPMARASVTRRLHDWSGRAVWREGLVTDNGNIVLDVHELKIEYPRGLESELNQIAGVVTVGLFAQRGADVLVIGGEGGVRTVEL